MHLQKLEIFIKVVDYKSFSKAAEVSGIAQPTVSLQVKQLEEELQTPLLKRTTRSISLTPAGEELYQEGKKLLAHRDEVLEKLSLKGKKTLVIGASQVPAGYLLPGLVAEFHEHYPEVNVKIIQGNSRETMENVRRYKVDVGFTGAPCEEGDLEMKALRDDEFLFVCPPGEKYRALEREKPELERLLKEPIIAREGGSGMKQYVEHILEKSDLSLKDMNVVATANDVDLIKKLGIKGVGCSFLSRIVVEEELRKGELIGIPISQKPRKLYVLWPRNIHMPLYIRAFLEMALERG